MIGKHLTILADHWPARRDPGPCFSRGEDPAQPPIIPPRKAALLPLAKVEGFLLTYRPNEAKKAPRKWCLFCLARPEGSWTLLFTGEDPAQPLIIPSRKAALLPLAKVEGFCLPTDRTKQERHHESGVFLAWPARRDSNPRPLESESTAISSFATGGYGVSFEHESYYTPSFRNWQEENARSTKISVAPGGDQFSCPWNENTALTLAQ